MYCYFNVLGPKKTLEESFNSTNGIWHETEIKSTANYDRIKEMENVISVQNITDMVVGLLICSVNQFIGYPTNLFHHVHSLF